MAHDLVIRGGTIVDGTGADPFSGDIGIDDGQIAAVGGSLVGDRVIDADGAIVTPGWVDVHTHYDGQATWDDQLDPSFSNGVTTLVMGNCGVGFAPCPPGEQATLIALMEGVEDIPGTALHEGVPWGAWQTFPEYLDFLGSRHYALDIAAQLAHGSLRFQVMRDRGVRNEDATAEDIAEMRRLVDEATAAGAVGFSTSRTIFHRSITGEAVPGTYASDLELTELVRGMADGGGGVFEAITSWSIGAMAGLGGERFTQDQELQLLADISRATGQKVTFTTVQHLDDPEAWRAVLDFAVANNAGGARAVSAGRVASGRDPRWSRLLPPVHASTLVPGAGPPPRCRPGPTHEGTRAQGAHPRGARRHPRRRRVDGDVRGGDADSRGLPVRARRHRRLRTGLRADFRSNRGRSRGAGDRSGLRLPRHRSTAPTSSRCSRRAT